MPNSNDYWLRICRGLGLQELMDDHRFKSSEDRTRNSSELIAILEKALSTKNASEWFTEWSNLGLVVKTVGTLKDLSQDKQAWMNRYIIEVDDTPNKKRKTTGLPVDLQKTPGKVVKFGPELAGHSTGR